MTLEEIESMELTNELIEQVQQETTPENIARIVFLTARMWLDETGGNREVAKAQAETDYQEYSSVYGVAPRLFELQLKAIDVLGDFRAKKAANPHADQSKGLTANDTTGNGCCEHCTTAAGGKQEEE